RAKSGKKILIDSSKYPAYGALLSRLRGYDVRFVHLVRDSRDVANSVRKEMPYHGDGSGTRRMKTHSVVGGGVRWLLSNAGAAVIPRALGIPTIRIRYEDQVADPEAALRPLAELIGVAPEAIPVRGRVAELRERHQISGNPSRFEVGTVEIKRLGPGRQLLTRGEEALVTALTLPGLWRYGYLGRTAGRRP
ncbi:MAG: sulfotransferase, partial [Gemmatimonadetes bacterium]|nr:sulfotransferase [Gemmatimonadota bacterium]